MNSNTIQSMALLACACLILLVGSALGSTELLCVQSGHNLVTYSVNMSSAVLE
jgi:hypothetical protein